MCFTRQKALARVDTHDLDIRAQTYLVPLSIQLHVEQLAQLCL